jgi:hypothetical protein
MPITGKGMRKINKLLPITHRAQTIANSKILILCNRTLLAAHKLKDAGMIDPTANKRIIIVFVVPVISAVKFVKNISTKANMPVPTVSKRNTFLRRGVITICFSFRSIFQNSFRNRLITIFIFHPFSCNAHTFHCKTMQYVKKLFRNEMNEN